jgi:hypothetical protein
MENPKTKPPRIPQKSGEPLSKTASPPTESLKPTLIWLKTVKTEETKSEGVKDEG